MKKWITLLIFLLSVTLFFSYNLINENAALYKLNSICSGIGATAVANENKLTVHVPYHPEFSHFIISSPYAIPDEINLNKIPARLQNSIPLALDSQNLTFYAILNSNEVIGGFEIFCPEEASYFFTGNLIVIENKPGKFRHFTILNARTKS